VLPDPQHTAKVLGVFTLAGAAPPEPGSSLRAGVPTIGSGRDDSRRHRCPPLLRSPAFPRSLGALTINSGKKIK
jgi:hypothetical protein